MRPIVGTGSGNVAGANANEANPRPTIVTWRAYNATRTSGLSIPARSGPPAQANTPSSPGFNNGIITKNATFKDSNGRPPYNPYGRPIGQMRYVQPYTAPAAIVILRPKARGMSYQVTNTDVRHKQPGWTYTLPIDVNTKIGRAIRRNYMHTGA